MDINLDFFKKGERQREIEEIKKNTRRYAKRQMTWFRRDPETIFFNPEDKESVIEYLENTIPN